MREREQQLCSHQPVALQEGLQDGGDQGQLPPASCLAVQLQERTRSSPPAAGELTRPHLVLHVWNILIPVFLVQIKSSISITVVTGPYYLQNFTVGKIVHLLL